MTATRITILTTSAQQGPCTHHVVCGLGALAIQWAWQLFENGELCVGKVNMCNPSSGCVEIYGKCYVCIILFNNIKVLIREPVYKMKSEFAPIEIMIIFMCAMNSP